MEKRIDLRSDTVTLPTEEMREAMRNAVVGDDGRREDPTVNKLQEMAAAKFGKEAGLLVVSGTMGNIVALLTYTHHGQEVIIESDAHMFWSEAGGMAALAGVLPRRVAGNLGVLEPLDVENAIRPESVLFPRTGLICIENTHNRAGGTIWTPEETQAIKKVADKYGLPIHIDGARIFNAAVALKVDVKELTKDADSVTFCLSKGLSAPVGSVLVGKRDFIERARKIRQMLGGGMRQAGIIAAAGIVAIEKMVDRLEEDHRNARLLGEELAKIEGIKVDLKTVQTNMVKMDISPLAVEAPKFLEEMAKRNILALAMGKTAIRLVTHRHIDKNDVFQAVEVIGEIVKSLRG